MDYRRVQEKIVEIYKACEIDSFPIDCLLLLEQMGIDYKPYSELPKEKTKSCFMISDDAFTLKGSIYYNDIAYFNGRIRFSLMHELGHISLGHSNHSEQEEQEANYFASNILAPRIAIYYSGCKNHPEVSKLFGLSAEAADIAFNDYRRWRRISAYKTAQTDKILYHLFYDKDLKKFIYHYHTCLYCGQKICNNLKSTICTICSRSGRQSDYSTNSNPLSLESRVRNYLDTL